MTDDPVSSSSRNDPEAVIADLHLRIAALEQHIQNQSEDIAQLRDQNELLHAVVDQMPYAIYWKDSNLIYRGCNQKFAADLGIKSDEIVGKKDQDLSWQESEVELFEAIDQRILETQVAEYDDKETVIHPNGVQEWFETHKLPLHDRDGNSIGVLATYNNITARKQAEATVLAQAALLQELSTPVIPLTDQILVMPLVGIMDSYRAQHMLETVLEHLATSHAQTVILDITGVPIIDTHVAQTLIQIGQAIRLLGSRLVLTGIRPEVAQSLVGLGVELNTIVTYSTLQRGLADIYLSPPHQRRRRG